MKTTKRTIGAFAFLAALVMIMSIMTPLTNAGADNSAPVLFSNESEKDSSSDIDILGTWTNEDGLTLKYAQTYYRGETTYGLIAQFDNKFPLYTYNTIMPKLDASELLKVAIDATCIIDANRTLNTTLNGPLNSGEHTYSVYDPDNKGKTTSSVKFTIGSSYVGVTTSNYFESAEDAKATINNIWKEGKIADVADKTMFIIYDQIGTFTNDVMGELYFNDRMIYSETLKNEEGQRIWYFTFNQPNANGDSIPYVAGEYTMKLISNNEVLAVKKVAIPAVAIHTITATAGENGSITPSGTVNVAEGSSQSFTFTSTAGFEIDQVLVDGSPVDVIENTYEFKNVTKNHTISVTFKESGDVPQNLIIEAEAGKGGSISPEGKVEVTTGGNQTFTITSDSGYKVDKVLVDNKEVSLTDGKYTFSNVTENHLIKVTFKKSDTGGGSGGGGGGVITTNYTITATAGSGGNINPSGNVSVKSGDSKTFTITSDSGYKVDKVLVDNKEVSLTDGKYTFSNVTKNHTISVTFKESGDVPQNLIIEAEAGKGGSISPEGKVEVTTGGNQTFTITSDSGYKVDKVLVDNKEVSLTDGKYTFSNVTENHLIKVTFVESGETPTPSGDGGKGNTMYYIIAAIILILIIIAIVYFVMKK